MKKNKKKPTRSETITALVDEALLVDLEIKALQDRRASLTAQLIAEACVDAKAAGLEKKTWSQKMNGLSGVCTVTKGNGPIKSLDTAARQELITKYGQATIETLFPSISYSACKNFADVAVVQAGAENAKELLLTVQEKPRWSCKLEPVKLPKAARKAD